MKWTIFSKKCFSFLIQSFLFCIMLSFLPGCFLIGLEPFPHDGYQKNCQTASCTSSQTTPSSKTNPQTSTSSSPSQPTKPEVPTRSEERLLLQNIRVTFATGNASQEDLYHLQKELNGIVEPFNLCQLSAELFPSKVTQVSYNIELDVQPDGRISRIDNIDHEDPALYNLGMCLRKQLLSQQLSLPPKPFLSIQIKLYVQLQKSSS